MTENRAFIKWGAFILLCIIWGSSFILMKWSKQGLTGSQIASVRILSAGIVFLPFALFHIFKIPARKLLLVIITAITGNLLPAYLYAEAIAKNTDSSLAGILNSVTPIFVVLIGYWVFKLKVKPAQITGVIIGFLGLCLLTLSKNGIGFSNYKYALLIVLATVLYGFNVNMVGQYLGDIKPLYVATVSIAFMIIPTAFVLWQQHFLQLAFDEPEVQQALLASSILGVVGSAIATVLFYILVKNAGALFASLVTYGIPFISLVWGIIDGEQVTLINILCLLVILSGVYLARK